MWKRGMFGAWDKAVAAYNHGPGNVRKKLAEHGDQWREKLPLETRNYLAKILPACNFLCTEQGQACVLQWREQDAKFRDDVRSLWGRIFRDKL